MDAITEARARKAQAIKENKAAIAAYEAEQDRQDEIRKAEHKASVETYAPSHNTATDKQRKFAEDLCKQLAEYERDLALEVWNRMKQLDAEGKLTKHAISQMIDGLKVMVQQRREKDHRAPQGNEPEAGVYRSGSSDATEWGKLYRVYLGQQSGRMLAKRIVSATEEEGVTYEYVGQARRLFTRDDTLVRLTVDEVGDLGLKSNHCLLCGKQLDVPESVDRGIGPVCAANY